MELKRDKQLQFSVNKGISSIINKKKNSRDKYEITDNPWQWCERYRKFKNQPVSYKLSRLEPWKTIHEDRHPAKVIIKSRKVTASEQMINDWAWFIQKNRFTNQAMAFPQQTPTADNFSKSRVAPAIYDCPQLRENINANQVHTKSFIFHPNEEQFLYIMGVISAGGGPAGDRFRSFVLAKTFYDEVQLIPYDAHSTIDEAKDPSLETYERWYSGTPTTPGNVLNATLWNNSKQHIFQMKCGACNHWNIPTVKTNIHYKHFDPFGKLHPEFMYPLDERNKIKDAYLGCERCGRSIEHLRGRLGNFGSEGIACWVPQTDPEKEINGYFVNKLILNLPLHSIQNILKDLANPDYSKRKKYNEILGYAHVGEDSPFSLESMKYSLLNTLKFSDFSRDLFHFFIITIDWGKPSWFAVHGVTLDNNNCNLFLADIGHTHDEDERNHGKELNYRLAKKWGDAELVFNDFGYSTHRHRDLYPGFTKKKVYSIDANVGKEKSQVHEHLNIDAKQIRKSGIIKASRDFMLETFEDALDENETKWYVPYGEPEKKFDGMELKNYLLHCSNVYRQPYSEFKQTNQVFEELRTEKTAYYKDAGSPDHSLMLFSYASLILHQKIRRLLLRPGFKVL